MPFISAYYHNGFSKIVYVHLMTQRFHRYRCASFCVIWCLFLVDTHIIRLVLYFCVFFLGVARFIGTHAHHRVLCYFSVCEVIGHSNTHTHNTQQNHIARALILMICFRTKKLNISRISVINNAYHNYEISI